MKKIVAETVIICLFITGCEYNNISPNQRCYLGKIILSSCCTGSTFIDLESAASIGKATELNGQQYANVIQVPGYLGSGDVYMNLREFNPDRDYNLFPNPHCYCPVAVGMDVPVMVATAVSHSSCPNDKNAG